MKEHKTEKSSRLSSFIEGRWGWFIVIIGLLAVAGIKLVTEESEFLLRSQEMNLWLPTGLYWKTLMQYPGGAVSWLATYLTQYFYHPWMGVSILCGLWLIICLLITWIYQLKGPWVALTALVPLALLACIVQTGYWIFYQKLPGHLFVPTIGVLFAVLCMAIQHILDLSLPSKVARWIRLVWMTFVCIIGYPFFGAWALGATGLLAALPPTPSRLPLSSMRLWIRLILAILLIAAIPQIYYQRLFEMTFRDFVYVAALPSMRYSQDSFEQYRLPYYAIIAAFLILIPIAWCSAVASRQPASSTAGRVRGVFATKHFWLAPIITLILLCAAVFGVSKAWYHDVNFQKELAMNRAVEDLDWERVLTIARDGSTTVRPTRQMVMYKNLALFRLGRAGNEMFDYPEGSTPQNAPWKVRITQVGGKLIYYHYGKENFCYRWCMEDGVEFGWKAETLKFMARTSLLNREWTAARKYLDLLKKTTFHREWAERYEKLLSTPDAFDLQKAEAAAKAGKPLLDEQMTREFLPIMHMMTYPDRLDGDNTLVEMYLLQTFAHGNGDDPLFQEMTLICALIMKDIDIFWPRFMKYASMNPNVHMPRHYQEAAYLYGHLENKVDISHMPFDKSTKETYDRFMKFNEQCGAMTEEQKAVAFYPQFGNTFYYFYFLVRNQKTN
ncbi:MAG: hypothetical protein J5545_04205 [Bacteroidaceae bacterium]|nr:hypothetical protein [Bacteroidaceae bacterium]